MYINAPRRQALMVARPLICFWFVLEGATAISHIENP
jgi:hypothetical protein